MIFVIMNLIQKSKPFVKPIAKKKLATVDHITGDKIPRSFVFSRGRLPGPLRQLKADLRNLLNPFTALNLKVIVLSYVVTFDFRILKMLFTTCTVKFELCFRQGCLCNMHSLFLGLTEFLAMFFRRRDETL